MDSKENTGYNTITMSKWDELNEIGRGDMTKRRNSQAVAAWSRHQGAHSPGTKKPDVDDTDEQLEELEDELEKMTSSIEKSLRSLAEEIEEDDREEEATDE